MRAGSTVNPAIRLKVVLIAGCRGCCLGGHVTLKGALHVRLHGEVMCHDESPWQPNSEVTCHHVTPWQPNSEVTCHNVALWIPNSEVTCHYVAPWQPNSEATCHQVAPWQPTSEVTWLHGNQPVKPRGAMETNQWSHVAPWQPNMEVTCHNVVPWKPDKLKRQADRIKLIVSHS